MKRKWRLRLDNLVCRNSDATLWTADGACPFPLTGYNLASVKKARVGWWVYPGDRWVTLDFNEMQVVFYRR